MNMLEKVQGLINAQHAVHITDFYQAKNAGGLIEIHSTAPGAMEFEKLGLLRTQVSALAEFFVALDQAYNPQVNATEQFVKELKNLPPAGKKSKKADKAAEAVQT